ncbi:MAG TPA: serine/threonine protein phosphatase, partial [Accumulibacter sp.]|nr:serine/threonine protein phosphatase [Accumulibacter sp.]
MGAIHRLAGPQAMNHALRPDDKPRPWPRALGWLLFLGPFFFLSYGFANWLSGQRADVGSIVFDWERRIPFVAWTIVPYWLMDLFYGVSLFLCRNRRQLDTHAWRLLATQVLAVLCFIVWPLRCTFERGEVDGTFGWLFAALGRFDQPFNQAPSLHIALLVVLLEPYLRALPRRWHAVVWGMALLIGVSVLTTWQHQFFDIPTGLWLGAFVIWLLPSDDRSPLARAALSQRRKNWRLAGVYAAGALSVAAMALGNGGAWLWLLWPAASLGLVASIYAVFDATAFGKRADGTMPTAVRLLFAPYHFGAWLNSRAWTRRLPPANTVVDGLAIARLPSVGDMHRHSVTALVDLCAELPGPRGTWPRAVIPMFDLLPPTSG